MSHQHCPNFTMPNNSTIQKCPKAKITTWSQEFPAKSYNVHNFNKSKQQQNDNVSTSSSQQNMKLANLPTKKPKNELTLKSFLECGAWVLEEPFFLIPFKGWVIFFPIKRKKGRPIGRCHCQCKKKKKKKNEGLEMGFKKWVCSKDDQEHKDLKNYWGRWMKASLEA